MKTTQLIGIVVLMIVVLVSASWSQTSSDKARILSQLTEATKAQLPARASAAIRTSPTPASQLALDLIVYRWLIRSSTLPMDITNFATVLPALTQAINNQNVNVALQLFSTNQKNENTKALFMRENEQITLLAELQEEYITAVNYKLSYPVEAVNSLKNLVETCQNLQLDISAAVILKELGDHYLYDMARYREAETCYRRAAWNFSTYNCVQSSAIVYDDYGTLSVETGRYAAATENYTMAAQQWVLLSGRDPSGYRYRDLAAREYMRAGDALRASGDTDKALEIMSAYALAQQRTWAHSAKSFTVLIENLITVAELFKGCGNIPRALDLLGEAKRTSIASNDMLLTARTYEKLADVYSVAHQTAKATEAKRKHEQALNQVLSTGEAAIIRLEKFSIAAEDTRLDLYAKAESGAIASRELGNLDKAVSTWERIAAIFSRMNLIERRISALCTAASILDEQQKPQRSLEIRREAAMAAMQSNKKAIAADIVEDMVQAFIDIGDLQNALEGFIELVPIIESSGKLRGSARVLEARGILLAKDGQYNAAIRDLQDARIRYLTQIGDLWSGCEVSLKLAAAQKAAGHIADSRSTLEAILSELESKTISENLDPTINTTRANLVKDIIHDLAVIYITDTSVTAESRRSSAEAIIQKAKRYNWLPDLINQLKRDATKEVAHFARNLNIIGGDGQENRTMPGTNTLLANDWSSYAQACWMLEKQYPTQYNALPVNPLDLFKVRNLLPKFGMVVEYMFTDSSVYIFSCKYGKSICREIGISKQDVDKAVSQLRSVIKNCEESQNAGIPVPPISDWQSADFADIQKPLEKLYELLIAPIKADIETAQALYFALPGELAGLPMHALIKPGNPEQPPYFLLKEYAISYLGKGMLDNLIYESEKQIDPSTDRLALFVDPQNNLPGAQEEAKAIRAAYLNSQWYIGERATAANFLNEVEKSNVLHLAVHHKIDPNPAQFELLFADDLNASGSLTIKELSTIKNKNLALVVLSACDSIASSDPISSGPSRAAEVFSMVGAKSIIGGIWKVSDNAASKVMGDFYQELIKGKPKIEALRAAQLAAIEQKQFAHPFYWACFALYGSPL